MLKFLLILKFSLQPGAYLTFAYIFKLILITKVHLVCAQELL